MTDRHHIRVNNGAGAADNLPRFTATTVSYTLTANPKPDTAIRLSSNRTP